MNEPATHIANGRSCDGCTLCCKLLRIDELDKPRLEWCAHCDIGVGCRMYDDRPPTCRAFHCDYLIEASMGAHWRPADLGMVVARAPDANRLVVYVDAEDPGAWRRDPYHADIMRWVQVAAENEGEVMVSEGLNMIALAPHGETDLGPVRDDQRIVTRRRAGAGDTGFSHIIVDQDDPVLAALALLQDADAARTATPETLSEARRLAEAWLAQHDR